MENENRTPETYPETSSAAFGSVDPERMSMYFEACSHTRRRYVLYHLRREREASIEDAAVQVAAWEQGCDRTAVDGALTERVRQSLFHQHLPKLDVLTPISYDRESGTAAYRDDSAYFDRLIDTSMAAERGVP